MKRGDILLFLNNDWFGKIITWFTGGKYSHSAIYWGKGKILEISPLYLKVIPLSKKKHSGYDVYTTNCGELLIEKALSVTHEQVKKMKCYDMFNALFFVVLKLFKLYKFRPIFRMFEDKKRVICSEVACDYLQFLGLKLPKYAFTPNSLIPPSEIPKAFWVELEK